MAKTFQELFAEAQQREGYWQEWATIDFAEELSRRMKACGLSRSDLARKLKVSPAYITKVLRGDENFTIRSMVKLARAVDSIIRVHFAPLDSRTVWIDAIDGGNSNTVAAANKTARVTFDRRLAIAPNAAAVSGAADAASVPAAVGFEH